LFVCVVCLLAKMFVIQSWNYILKCVWILQYFLPKWHVIKTKHTCSQSQVRWVRDWTHLGWLEVSRTHLASLGEFGKPQAAQSLNSLYILNIYTEYLTVISIGNLVPRASVWGRGETRGSPGLGRSILHYDWLTPYYLKITELDSWQ
jgi:hypothetical protein